MTNKQQQQCDSDESFSPSHEHLLAKLYKENQDMKTKITKLEAIEQAKRFDTGHVKALVQPFSGDDLLDIDIWIEKLEDAFRVLNLYKTERLVAASELLTGTAEVFRRTISPKDYEDLRSKLLEEFRVIKRTDEAIVKELRKCRLLDKNVHRYVLEMIEKGNGYDIAEVDLVDIIIDGLNDNSYVVTMLYGVKTINELKQLLPRYTKRRYPA